MTATYPTGPPNPWQPGPVIPLNPYAPPPTLTPAQILPSIGQPQILRAPLKCRCGKFCSYRAVVKLAEKLKSGEMAIKAQQDAAVCPDCGVIAWL